MATFSRYFAAIQQSFQQFFGQFFRYAGNMPPRQRQAASARRPRRAALVLVLALGWSLSMGWGLSQVSAQVSSPVSSQVSQGAIATTPEIGTVDLVPERLQLGQRLYLQNCSGCHFAPPPEIMPLQSWAAILQTPQHYGTVITPLQDPARLILWNYVRASSRSIVQGETVPSRFGQSRYLKALHPGVNLPEPASFGSCVTCHPAAVDFNFRRLSPEWQEAG